MTEFIPEALSLERPAGQHPDYQLSFAPHKGRVRAVFAGVTVADSKRVMVMDETRLAPVYYLPRKDVRMDLLTRTEQRSHCPFKGNASYWSLAVGERQVDDVMWSYEDPLPDAAAIRDYVAFYANQMDAWYEGDEQVDSAKKDLSGYQNPLLSWLLNDAPAVEGPKRLTNAFAEHLLAVGIPVWRLGVIVRTLHPQIVGVSYRWWRPKLAVEELSLGYDRLDTPAWLNSPLVPIFEGAGGIRRRLDIPNPVFDYPILVDLHSEGVTDYVAMPMTFSDGQINVLTLATDHPGGFTTADLGHVYEILSVLGRIYEVHAMRHRAVTLLDTYLGQHAGQRVLSGDIKRGDGQTIHAVIWFCDLRDSTPLAQSMSREEFLGALNQFFDCMTGAVLDAGGQVLRFIGDAALAIFPLGDCDLEGDVPPEACRLAVSAIRDAVARLHVLNIRRSEKGWDTLRYGIALHLGEVTYGNIGTENRLEFTVIGDAANRAARIESMCKTLNEPVLLSEQVARYFPDECRLLGLHVLRGIDEPLPIYALNQQASRPAVIQHVN